LIQVILMPQKKSYRTCPAKAGRGVHLKADEGKVAIKAELESPL